MEHKYRALLTPLEYCQGWGLFSSPSKGYYRSFPIFRSTKRVVIGVVLGGGGHKHEGVYLVPSSPANDAQKVKH